VRHRMSSKLISHLKAEDFGNYRDDRSKVSKPASVLRHMRLLRHALKVASDSRTPLGYSNEQERQTTGHTPIDRGM
jgi:hypothetical protein